MINQINTQERGSALHLAAKSNYLPICQVLLLKGIDITIKDSNGQLAKDVTTNEQIRNLIEKYEANTSPTNNAPNNMIDEIKEEDEEGQSDDEGNERV